MRGERRYWRRPFRPCVPVGSGAGQALNSMISAMLSGVTGLRLQYEAGVMARTANQGMRAGKTGRQSRDRIDVAIGMPAGVKGCPEEESWHPKPVDGCLSPAGMSPSEKLVFDLLGRH